MPYWSGLSVKRFGTYVEYLAKLEFIRLGADIYFPEVDDRFYCPFPRSALPRGSGKRQEAAELLLYAKDEIPDGGRSGTFPRIVY